MNLSGNSFIPVQMWKIFGMTFHMLFFSHSAAGCACYKSGTNYTNVLCKLHILHNSICLCSVETRCLAKRNIIPQCRVGVCVQTSGANVTTLFKKWSQRSGAEQHCGHWETHFTAGLNNIIKMDTEGGPGVSEAALALIYLLSFYFLSFFYLEFHTSVETAIF